MYKCDYCDYFSDRKYNLTKHQNAKHKDIINNNIELNNTNIVIEEDNACNDFKCRKCNKSYKTKKSFENHELTCNGCNILTCPKCRKLFADRQSKYKHIKRNTCIEANIIDVKMTNTETNYIYLLYEREFIKTNEYIYKIGKSKQENLKRICNYPNGSKLLFQIICENCDVLEKYLIKLFDTKYEKQKDIGNEYYKGDYIEMIKDIYKTAL